MFDSTNQGMIRSINHKVRSSVVLFSTHHDSDMAGSSDFRVLLSVNGQSSTYLNATIHLWKHKLHYESQGEKLETSNF